MHQTQRITRPAEEMARIREIVGRHELPEFVDGFDVQFGSYEDEPAAWITFKLLGSDGLGIEELQRRAAILVPLQNRLFDELMDGDSDRWPFFRVTYRDASSHVP